jgi:hypothetical protein
MTYTEINDECIICLSDTPEVMKYDAPCECKPFIHNTCLNDWFQVNPNTCPICKTNYEGLAEGIINPLRPHINSYCLLILMAVLFSIFVYCEYLM